MRMQTCDRNNNIANHPSNENGNFKTPDPSMLFGRNRFSAGVVLIYARDHAVTLHSNLSG